MTAQLSWFLLLQPCQALGGDEMILIELPEIYALTVLSVAVVNSKDVFLPSGWWLGNLARTRMLVHVGKTLS